MADISLKQMMEAGVHFGHQTKRWNPSMKKYIFTNRNGISIIDLNQSVTMLRKAIKFAYDLGTNGGTVLFVATKTQARDIIVEEATKIDMPYVIERWLGGMMTNFETVRKSVARLLELDGMEADGTFEVLAKKEVGKLQKERAKLNRNLGGIKNMDRLPNAIFIVDTKKEKIGLAEARKLNIPVIAIVDTNCDPEGIDHIIPGNDDAVRSIKLITSLIAGAVTEGREAYKLTQQALAEEREKAKAEDVKRRAEAKAAKAAMKVEAKPAREATKAVAPKPETDKSK